MMTYHNADNPNRAIPRCMRITEKPLPLPEGGLQSLLDLLANHAAQGNAQGELLTDSQLKTLAIQTWRLGRRIDRLPEDDNTRTKRQFRDSYNRLSEVLSDLGVTIDDPIGRGFTDGWIEVEVIARENPDGPAPEGVTGPWIKQTIKPVIKKSRQLLMKGEVIIADPYANENSDKIMEENK